MYKILFSGLFFFNHFFPSPYNYHVKQTGQEVSLVLGEEGCEAQALIDSRTRLWQKELWL